MHISKREISEQLSKKLVEQLASLLVAQDTLKSSKAFLYEMLSHTERIMLAKRIGILFFLHRGYSLYATSQILAVSESTVARIKNKLDDGEYVHIVQTIQRKEHRESILGTIETLVRFGLSGGPQAHLRKKVTSDIRAWRQGA